MICLHCTLNLFSAVNLFPSIPPSTNESDLRNQRISTRLFIIALVFSTTILIGYNFLIDVTKVNNINSPNLTQYLDLYSQYPQTLTCPCTDITIKYEEFLQIEYTLHQLCSSTFVTNDWIAYLAQNHVLTTDYVAGFLELGTYMFQALKTFCESSNKTISDSLSQFYFNEYTSLTVISKQLFESQSQILMDQFKSSTKYTFLSLLQTLRDTTQANTPMSAVQSAYVFVLPDIDDIVTQGEAEYQCSCDLTPQCTQPLQMYDYNFAIQFSIPGLRLGCFVIEGVLQSTLECFYNQTCLNKVQSYIISPISINVIALNSSLSSQFNQTSTIQEIVNELMVDKWNLSMIYENYYKQCQPIKCSYTYVDRNNIIFIITTLIGLIGGLVKILRFMIPKLVKFIPRLMKNIRKYFSSSRSETENNVIEPTIRKWQKIRNFLQKLNLFPSIPPSTNESDLRNQRISTRLFIIALVFSTTILIGYNFLIDVTKVNNINSPNLTQYLDLYSQYPQTLTCPCTDITIKYEEFLQIEYTLHQLCSSTFVTDDWLEYLEEADTDDVSYIADIRFSGIYLFQILKTFCESKNNAAEPTIGKWQKIKNFLRKFNLFPSIPPSTNESDLRNQQLSTRLFLTSLILIMAILITYNASINVTKTVTIDKPTLTQYLDLYSTHSEVLTCPCTTISIGYDKFVHIQYTLHQVCNSTFVNNTYIENIFWQNSPITIGFPDFFITYPYILNALALFCQLTDNIVSDSLIEFYSNQYLSATVTPKQLFELQAQASFQQFIISKINDLLFIMQFIRDTTQANNFFSGILTNYDFELVLSSYYRDMTLLQPIPFELSNCSCMLSALCTEQAVIYDNDYNNNSSFIVPGLYVGCYIVEALLQSTLECFFNQTCLSILQSYGGFSSFMDVIPLNSSLSSRYNETSTIEELVNELMIENWNLSIIYENYYNGCQPTQCSYSYTAKNNAIYIATMIFGLIGGLMTILQCFIPRLVRLIARCFWKRRIVPEMPVVQA
ncbi:unnamed protein product [Adineta steineri]|uniref:Transmembrane protein n=1 Tax=Adineta steineri TaxID=433720 RepID=A0A819L8V7_9BILA|nr:unnamed protein product [Adineta steineri]